MGTGVRSSDRPFYQTGKWGSVERSAVLPTAWSRKRPVYPKEFRGFALSDPLAPLVFINGADTKAAQMFTLAHEIAHIFLGKTAISDTQARSLPRHKIENWCNQVAAELLVPLDMASKMYNKKANFHTEAQRLGRHFKVSTLVILRRLQDMGKLKASEFRSEYEKELKRLKSHPQSSGGNFYLTLGARVSRPFAEALIVSTLEGRTLFRESFRLLGIKKLSTFKSISKEFGV